MRPRLLFLSHVLPYPPDIGVAIRTYNILRVLAREFEVMALCFHRTAHLDGVESVHASLAALSELAEVETFAIPAEHSRVRLTWDHVRSLAWRRPYTHYLYSARPYRDRVRELLASRSFDLVHVDSLDLCAYLPLLEPLPVVCVHHSAESILLRRRAEAQRTRWRRAYLAYQARLLEETERRWCARVAVNVAVSDEDRRQLERTAPDGRYAVVPNGVDLTEFRPMPGAGRTCDLVFVGGSNWFPNRDALEYFCAEILPLIRRRNAAATVSWVGKAEEEDRERFGGTPGVRLTGYVEDIRPYVREAACFVVPLRVGGGTRLKILMAWAMGKAVVSTSVGCEGLAAVDGENILVADTPTAFAEAVDAVLRDPDLRSKLGAAGRRTAERLYGWDVVGRAMVQQYVDLIGQHTTRTRGGTSIFRRSSAYAPFRPR